MGRGVPMMSRGRGKRARTTSWWVFGSHLVLLFTATLGAMLCFSQRAWVAGGLSTAAWVILFVITSLDNVRIEWIQRACDRAMVEAVRLTQRSGEMIVPAETPPRNGVDAPREMGDTESEEVR